MEKQRENVDRKNDDTKDMINQLLINQNKGKDNKDEESNHRRKNSHDSRFWSERLYIPHHNEDFYQQLPRQDYRHIYDTFPWGEKVDPPSFYGRENLWVSSG